MLNFARAGLNFYSDITHQHVAMRKFPIVPHIKESRFVKTRYCCNRQQTTRLHIVSGVGDCGNYHQNVGVMKASIRQVGFISTKLKCILHKHILTVLFGMSCSHDCPLHPTRF